MKRFLQVFLFVMLALSETGARGLSDMYAYYTRVRSGESFEEYSRVGEYPDIVVHLNKDLKVVFWRGSSYLPYLQSAGNLWYLDEIIPRSGDGSGNMPDRHNRYSHVRIIENSPGKVVVHWRYVPDFSNPGFTGIVDEYFTFTPDLKLVREVRKGTDHIDRWNDPGHIIVQKIGLGATGINELSRSTVIKDVKQPGSPYPSGPVKLTESDAIIHFGFDESQGTSTMESVQEMITGIAGHKALWKKGISGSCLQFDGYYSSVKLPGYYTQNISNEITLEGWIALGAYPFDWAPVVHQSSWGHKGFYLGMDQRGRPGFHVSLDGKWNSVVSDSSLELFRWYHLAGTLNEKGEMDLYVDGERIKSSSPGPGTISLNNSDLAAGLNSEKLPMGPGRIRKGKYPSMFGMDGLMDEVQVLGKAKSAGEIFDSYSSISKKQSTLSSPDMEPRHWPVWPQGPSGPVFGARYAKLRYYETWDHMWRVSDHPDVVVTFDEIPCRIISWRGLSNGPVLVTENNLWVGDQSSENYKELDAEGEAEGCCEHMSDKQCRHAHIRIIENTPARVVLHYRYGMVDSRYIFPDIDPRTGWGDWADEIWTIYPDGVAVRHLERGMIWGDSWVETMFFSAPGQRPEEVVELKAYTVVDERGKAETWSWENGSPDQVFEEISIAMVNTRSEYKPYNIYPTGSSVEVFGGHGRNSKFHWWNHWPVSQITSDGRGAWYADRAAHSSLVWGVPEREYLMYGFTDKDPKELIPLARSWNNPPEIKDLQGAQSAGYRQERRAYTMERTSESVSFILSGSEETPVLNPCFVVKNWEFPEKARILLNDDTIPAGPENRQGIFRDTDGSRTLVIWLKQNLRKKVKIQIIQTQ